MSLQSSQIANQLKRQADELLFGRGVDALLKKYGEVTYTGSYALDLMAWPDIDVMLAPHENLDPMQAAKALQTDLGKYPDLVRAKLETEFHLRFPHLPKGIAIGAKFNWGGHKLPWKLDIWILDKEKRDKNSVVMQKIQSALTPEDRQLILNMKHRLMTPEGRTPSNSGFHLYQAVLFEKLTDGTSILEYLRARGIRT